MARAQAYNYPADQRDPAEYNDEDSQPLKIASYALAPIGFLLEWTIARPMHYLATQTGLAPVLSGDRAEDGYPPAPVAEIPPPDNIPNGSETSPYAVIPGSVVAPPATAVVPAPAAPAASTSQPVLH